ncbi:MAG: hypothetical protein DI639_08110 [Leifsonia xyli]|nr:MAG: hypothetical protein DI639_08110 [Leifsonia xyli]
MEAGADAERDGAADDAPPAEADGEDVGAAVGVDALPRPTTMSTTTTTMITSAPSTAARRRQYTTGFSGPTG